jgi:hypothetical protein
MHGSPRPSSGDGRTKSPDDKILTKHLFEVKPTGNWLSQEFAGQN